MLLKNRRLSKMINKKKYLHFFPAGIICLALIAVAVVALAVMFGRHIGPFSRPNPEKKQ